MSKKYVTPLLFKVYQSPLLIRALWVSHIIAFVAVLLSAVIYKFVVFSLIIVSLFFYIKREANYVGFSIRHSQAFAWEIAYFKDHFHSFEVLPSTVLTPYLIVLHIKQQNRKKQTILICKDALKNDDFRKLMVELKMSGLQKGIS